MTKVRRGGRLFAALCFATKRKDVSLENSGEMWQRRRTRICAGHGLATDDQGLNIWIPSRRPVDVAYGDDFVYKAGLETSQEVMNTARPNRQIFHDILVGLLREESII